MAQRLSNLKVGETVKFGKRWGKRTRMVITDKAHTGFPTNSVQLTNLYCDDTRPFDAKEPYNDRGSISDYGNNRLGWSNLLQWMNSGKKNWYTAKHASDQAPDASHVGVDAYDNIPGMLNEWDPREIAMCQKASRKVENNSYYGSTATITSKIWLYDYNELGGYANDNNVYSYGTRFPYFNDPYKRNFVMSEEGAKHSQAKPNGSDTITVDWTPKSGVPRPYWIANCYYYDYCCMMAMYNEGETFRTKAYTSYGVRFGVSLDGDVYVSSDKDADGDYTVLLSTAPPAPEKIIYDSQLRGGKDATVTWSKSTDPSITSIGYRLQVKYGSGEWTTVYEGIGTRWTGVVPFGAGTAKFRVCSINQTDSIDSEYTEGSESIVFSNHEPTITIAKVSQEETFTTEPPEIVYTVSDEDTGDTLTTEWKLDGKTVKTVTGRDVGTYTFTSDEWLRVVNGSHTMTIEVDDGKETATYSKKFTKNVTEAYFQNIIPVPATEAPTELICAVLGDIPEDVELYTIEACTNGFDDSPTWEDIKESVVNSTIYKFTNSAKNSEKWGVCIRIHVKRGKTEGYISSVLFNFLAGKSETSTTIGTGGGSTSITYSENAAGGNTVTIGG